MAAKGMVFDLSKYIINLILVKLELESKVLFDSSVYHPFIFYRMDN